MTAEFSVSECRIAFLTRRQLECFFVRTCLSAPALVLAVAPLSAQPPGPGNQRVEPPIEEVVTIGTRVAGRSGTETPAPVDIIDAAAIFRSQGQTETGKLLQVIAPSFNFSSTTISDGTDIIRPAALRGLGVDQVLVLVNGKRRHQTAHVNIQQTIARGSAGTDINAIPASAISRIEVLRDGAAAQYGSDAIAGVINIILKDQSDYTDLSAQTGQHYEGDGEVAVGSINTGFELGDGGFANLTFEYRDRGETNRATPAVTNLLGWYPSSVSDADLRSGAVPPEVKLRIGDAESENVYFWVNGAIPSGDDELYFFAGVSRREGDSSGFFRGPEDNRTVPAVYPTGFLPNIITELQDSSIAVGYRSAFADDWEWDISLVRGTSGFDFVERNTINVSWWFEPLDGMDAANGIFAESPTEADTGKLLHEETTFNMDFRGLSEYGQGRALNIAAGFEWREDNYEIKAGDPVSYTFGRQNRGDIPIFGQTGGVAPPATQGFPGFSPTEAVDDGRDSFAVYGDIESYVTDRVLLGGALRLEDFSDFGGTTNGKLSALFQVTDTFAIRGTASTGFRAPGVQQLFFSQKSTNLDPNTGTLTDTLNGSQAVADALGFQRLDEETSANLSLGLVIQPTDAWTITVDTYRIDIDDRIVFSSSLVPEGDAAFCAVNPCPIRDALEPLRVAQANIFTNAADTETTGLDIVARYATVVRNGQLDLDILAHFNETDVASINPSSTVLTPEVLFDDVQVTLIEEGQPQERYSAGATYTAGRWSVSVRANHFGEVSGSGFTGTKTTWGGKTLLDASARYSFGDNLTITFGGTNLFDEFPDEWGAGGTLVPPGTPGFDAGVTFGDAGFKYGWETLPFGINGGYYFARVDWRLGR